MKIQNGGDLFLYFDSQMPLEIGKIPYMLPLVAECPLDEVGSRPDMTMGSQIRYHIIK